MDAGDGPRADVVGQVAEYDAIHERGPEVFMEGHFQPHFDALGGGKQKEPVASKFGVKHSWMYELEHYSQWEG